MNHEAYIRRLDAYDNCCHSVQENPLTPVYFWAGAAGVGAGVEAGADFAGAVLTPDNTEREAGLRDAAIESVMEVSIKMTIDHVVALDNAVVAPRGPNAVWLPIPPKAAATSPLWPLCSSTTIIRNKLTTT
jgi:hypothetical protein